MYVYIYIYIYMHTELSIRLAVQYLLTFHSSLLYNFICWCCTASRNIYFELTEEDFLSISHNKFIYLFIIFVYKFTLILQGTHSSSHKGKKAEKFLYLSSIIQSGKIKVSSTNPCPHKKVSQDLTKKKQYLTEMSIILMVLTEIWARFYLSKILS